MAPSQHLQQSVLNTLVIYFVHCLLVEYHKNHKFSNKNMMSQPVDLKIDEETLMKLVPFWRASLAPSGTPSTQFYFRHFEVHPIKVPCSSFYFTPVIITWYYF